MDVKKSQEKVHMSELGLIIDRIKAYLNLKNDQDVADLLHLNKTALSERKRRDSVPRDKIALLCRNKNINMNWTVTGKGWAFNPVTTHEALAWMERHVCAINKIVIITYPPLEKEGGGVLNGFVLQTSKGIAISMNGRATRTGYMGAAPACYYQILKILRQTGIPVGQLIIKEKETAFNEIDFSVVISKVQFSTEILDNEIRNSGFEPNMYDIEDKSVPQFINPEQAILLRKAQRIFIEGNIAARALLRGTIEEIYVQLPEDEESDIA